MGRIRSVLEIVAVGQPADLWDLALHQHGWIVTRVDDAASAVAVLQQIRPAIILVRAEAFRADKRGMIQIGTSPLRAGLPVALEGSDATPGVDLLLSTGISPAALIRQLSMLAGYAPGWDDAALRGRVSRPTEVVPQSPPQGRPARSSDGQLAPPPRA